MDVNNIKKKMVSFSSKNKYLLSSIIILIIFLFINIFDIKYKKNSSMIYGYKYYFILLSIFVALAFIFYCYNKIIKTINNDTIPKIFVITSLTLGIIFIALSPLFTGSDEQNHYYRIYEITDGIMVTPTNNYVGAILPESLEKTFIEASGTNTTIKYNNLKKMNKVKLNKNIKKQYGKEGTTLYSNTALYSPIQYFPQVIGFSIGKILNLSPYLIGILGRIFNLLFYIILGYTALKLIPNSKLFYLLILISPNLMQCATTLSADAFTNVIFLLLIALVFKIVHNKEIITRKEEIIIFILSTIISLCKIVYIPIIFILLLLDNNKFKNGKKEKFLFVGVTIVISILLSLFWMSCTTDVFSVAYDKTALQKQFILANKFEYVIIFIRTMVNNFLKYSQNLFVGTNMYHSQLKIPEAVSVFYLLIIAGSLLKEKINILNKKGKIYTILIAIVIGTLISTAIYIQCTAQFIAVGNPEIGGLQGRYFIPIIMLIPYFIKINKKLQIDPKTLCCFSILINMITFMYMFTQFVI